MESLIGELAQQRLSFEANLTDYNNFIKLFDQNHLLLKLQLTMVELLTPTFYAMDQELQ